MNGVHNPIKRGKIPSKLKKEKTHIAFLLETHLGETEHIKLGRSGFKHVGSSSHKSGNKNEYILEKTDREGMYLLIKGKVEVTVITYIIYM